MRALLLAPLVGLLWGASAGADEAPYPEYPAFEPGEGFDADREIYSLIVLEKLEAAPLSSDVPLELDGFWRIGNSYHALWLGLEGDGEIPSEEAEIETRALYSRVLTAYFDVQFGVRVDLGLEEDDARARPHLALGLEGLAPYFFELEPAVFVSLEGDVSARLEASYDLLITQRLVLSPDVEVNAAVQEVEDWGVGSGLSDLELGARLRYEIVREIAPYVGVNWERAFFGTADLARAGGEPVSETRFVVGLRVWW